MTLPYDRVIEVGWYSISPVEAALSARSLKLMVLPLERSVIKFVTLNSENYVKTRKALTRHQRHRTSPARFVAEGAYVFLSRVVVRLSLMYKTRLVKRDGHSG